MRGTVSFRDVCLRIDSLKGECVDFLARICSIPALGPDNQGTGEMRKYEVIRETVSGLAPDRILEVHAPDSRVPDGVRPNLLAIFGGKDSSRTVWILTHVDVVPPGEQRLWDHDPFEPHLENGFLYGRGVEDNGQALAASIFALRAVKDSGGPALNVGLALVSDEETGSRYGLQYVLEQRPDLFSPHDLIVVPDAGNKDGDHIEIAEKHMLQVRFKVRGLQGHASRPDITRNSLRAAAHFIVELDEGLHGRFSEEDDFFNPPSSTFEPTRKDANVPNINTIPGEDVFYLDCRILPQLRLADVLEEMHAIGARIGERFAVETSLEECMHFEAPQPTPSDAPVVVELAQAVQEVFGVQARPVGIGGQTVAAFFRKRGLPAAVWGKMLGLAHAPNERISVEDLMGCAKVFARMMV